MTYENIVIITLVIAGCLLCYLILSHTPISEKEREERLKESLDDAFIIDPETGAKLTLEQAESGIWIHHDNQFRESTEEEINKLPNEGQQIVERAMKQLRSNPLYVSRDHFENDDFDVLEKSITLSHYDDWSFSSLFSFEFGFIFSPAPETNIDHILTQSQLMLWLRINSIEGHYYFREKTKAEAFFDKLRSDDELHFDDYECFTFKKSHQIIQIKRIIDILVEFDGLEIELMNDNLFIKSLRLINKEDILKFETVVATLQHVIKPFR